MTRTPRAAPTNDLVLPGDEVHVWYALLDQPSARLDELARTLSADEQARAERFRFERDRARWIVARGLLRELLGRYLGIVPGLVRFAYGPRGKPSLAAGSSDSTLRFNLSHADQLAVYAFTRCRELGVDVERVKPIPELESIADQFFSREEQAALRRLPPDELPVGFFNCWTRKEAYAKATGDGLTQPLDQFDVSLAPGHQPALVRVEGDPLEASRWSLLELAPAPGYVAALTVRGHGWHLSDRHWLE